MPINKSYQKGYRLTFINAEQGRDRRSAGIQTAI